MTSACKAARGLAHGVAVRGPGALLAETEAVIAAMATVAPVVRKNSRGGARR
ncbi:MAG TPA: hypothetical protein PKB04_03355 [Phenylobacterium sp.]|nr:hypothetical protein [Phenylobacterium sp.]